MSKQPLKSALQTTLLILAASLCGCLVDDPDFRANSKDAIIASKKHVVITPVNTPTKVPKK